MTAPSRDALIARTFVALADTMVADYDIVDLLQLLVERSAEVFAADGAGIFLANERGNLEVVASTDQGSRLIDLMQLGAADGPCIQAYLTGESVTVPDIHAARYRWPLFAGGASALGLRSVHSVPLRLRSQCIGALNLFRAEVGELSNADAAAARAMADIATIGILHERAFREASLLGQQLQRALDSRVVIERATGYIAHTHAADMDEAFAMIRQHARATRQRLQDVAQGIIDGTIVLDQPDRG